jgi:hypothetical protein
VRAGLASINFGAPPEAPKLAVTAVVTHEDFAARLERAIER